MAADCRLEDAERAGRELVLFELGDFVLGELGARFGEEFSVSLCESA